MFSQAVPPENIVLVCLDRPGYGSNGMWVESNSCSYQEFAHLAMSSLNALGFEDSKFGVLGHSSGGPCALALAILGGSRCVKCVLLASDVEYSAATELPDPYGNKMPKAPEPDAPGKDLGLCTERELEQDEDGLYDDTLRDSMQASLGLNGARLDFANERRSWDLIFSSLAQSCQVDVVYGTRDPYFKTAHAFFFAERIPQARIFPRQGYGHFDLVLDNHAMNFNLGLFSDF